MNREQLNIASDCLRAIKDNDGCVRDPLTGICDAMGVYFNQTHESEGNRDVIIKKVKELMLEWPLSSGNKAFPVPNPEKAGGKAAQSVYTFSRNMWVGPYGELRLNLLDWLIAKVETSLTDLKAK